MMTKLEARVGGEVQSEDVRRVLADKQLKAPMPADEDRCMEILTALQRQIGIGAAQPVLGVPQAPAPPAAAAADGAPANQQRPAANQEDEMDEDDEDDQPEENQQINELINMVRRIDGGG